MMAFRMAAVLKTLGYSAALTLALTGSANAQPAGANVERGGPLPLEQVRIFTEALDSIRRAYVEPIDDKTLLEYAIKGMLAGLDPHSAYLGSEDYESLQETTQGEFGGLGVEVGEENGYIKVISPIDDTPAARAGIEPGDLIIQIDDQPIRELPINEAVELMRGAPGTDIVLTIMREDVAEPFELTLTREFIAVNSVRQRTLEPGFGYIRISQFKVNTGDELLAALKELQDENDPLKGLVLDLRNNPGGILQASVDVVDAFLTSGRIVYTEGRFNQSELNYEATVSDPSAGVPTIVLINNGSASASEIVAGALQDHGRAVVMGTTSFGKGSVQTVLPLANDRALKLTTSLYFTPKGRSIQAQGIVPDIVVDEGLVTRAPNRRSYSEADLQGHLLNSSATEDEAESAVPSEVPGELPDQTDGDGVNDSSSQTDESEQSEPSEAGQPTPVTSARQVMVSDYQLNEALNLLKGLSIFQAAASGSGS